MSLRLEVKTIIKQRQEAEIRCRIKWLQLYLNEMWDRQIESDLKNGKLDSLITRAEADIEKNKVRGIDEVLRNL
jgi:hypothetical protein